MTELVLKIERESDLEALIPLLDRLKIKYVKVNVSENITAKELEAAIQIIRAGADFSNFGDPVEWQREQRKDRELPARSSKES